MGKYRCTFHDEVIPGRECPHGCSPAAVEELPEVSQEVDEVTMPAVTWTTPRPTTPIVPKRKRLRDSKGRMLPDPVTAVHPDEQMTVEEIVLSIQHLWKHARQGGRAALARALGLNRDQTRLIAVGNEKAISFISGSVRRRLSQALSRIADGRMELRPNGVSPAGYQMLHWVSSCVQPEVA